MATVFFKINNRQEKEIAHMMDEEGYTNKAEFFRFLVKFYKYQKSPGELRLENAAEELADVLKKLNKQGELTNTLEEQLADV
ncbi:MAG: hypothetical protein UV80_C0006G0093 [Candidatus Peregrinibacteria bacterium GW2011_GWF2_43_17]|nr:MAG: hypothetical protein UV80_C0006G0093 [Candidatus Peregrinibacteria bacterium GW2011_GWF2_43_17]KKT19013.1 MAG: hypothetical protein UW03_C0025G0005 [Candidatus Peregrinibacteria bacterium GW2011_GWA2_43_8]HAU40095.1 hypothetical protein [Candidatus Peregrinibacteria bacterium]